MTPDEAAMNTFAAIMRKRTGSRWEVVWDRSPGTAPDGQINPGPAGDVVHGLVKSGPVPFLAGLVEVFENVVEGSFVKAAPSFDSLFLFARGYEGFSFPPGDPGHSDISDDSHAPLAYRAYLSSSSEGGAGVFVGAVRVSPAWMGALAPGLEGV